MAMTDVKARKLDEIPFYQGAGAIPGIRFHMAARELGVSAWGMNVLALEPGCAGHPEHDHVQDGQEEVYVVLEGSGSLRAGGEETPLERGTMVRVGPAEKRKILAGAEGIVVLAIGGTPGAAYPRR
jgi:uncharacterized cupin superfamily protein